MKERQGNQERQTIVVEPNAIIREGLRRMLVERGFIVASANPSVETLRDLPAVPEKVTVLLSSCRGEDLCRQVRQVRALVSSAHIVVLGSSDDENSAAQLAIRLGISAYLHNTTTSEAFFRTLEFASQDLIVISRHEDAQPQADDHPSQDGSAETEWISTPEPAAAEPAHPQHPVERMQHAERKVRAEQSSARSFEFKSQPSAAAAARAHPAPSRAAPAERAYQLAMRQDPTLRRAAASGTSPQTTTSETRLDSLGRPSFSPRETAILKHLQNGEPNKQIARILSLSEASVKVHLKSLLRKIGVNNRTQAAIWAMQHMEPKLKNGSHAFDNAPSI